MRLTNLHFFDRVGLVFTKEEQSQALIERASSIKRIKNRDVQHKDDLYCRVKIESIIHTGDEPVYDIEVEGKHEFVANGFRVHNSFMFSYAYVIWRAYNNWLPSSIEMGGAFKSIPRVSVGYIFSNTQDQAINLLDLVKREIESNPKLIHLLPDTKDVWNKTEVKLSNGATIRARGWGQSVRGAHPVYVVADDCLNDETIYSEITRNRQIDYFYSAVTPMLVPGGQLIVVGCVRPDTFVLTRDGIKQIGKLVEGGNFSDQRAIEFNREVYGENGFKNASKLWVNGKCKTKRITTTYGLEIEGSHRHPLRVQHSKTPRHRKSVRWERMDNLKLGQLVQVEIGQNVYGNKFNDTDLAYFMGLWTAEGSSEPCGRLTICTSEPTLLSYLESKPMGYEFSRHQNKSRVQSVELYSKMKSLGVKFEKAECKVVPDCIFSATREAQAAFIRGFADGDGCSYSNGRLQQINLSSASKELIVGIRAILMNMGMLPSYLVKPPGVSKLVVGKFDSHQLVLSAGYAYKFMKEVGFTVAHKKKEFKPMEAKQKLFVGIKGIEDGECETVDFVIPDDHTFCSNGFISHNTPFHQEDLYQKLSQNSAYFFHRSPSISDTGEALWPTRYTKEMLMKRKEEVGSTRFAREYLCLPIGDDSSLFPESILQPCYDNQYEMPAFSTAEDRKALQIYTGVDLALSSTVGADYTVITTLGVDQFKNRWIMDIRRKRGLGMMEQLREIQDVHKQYKPQKIYIEDNGFQRVFRDELIRNTDLPVEGFTTGAHNKNSLERGVPSLQILFENRKFVIPRKTERDRRITDILINELKCFTWQDGKLQGVGAHDDCVLSLWLANECASSSTFSFSFVGD
jgi:intein/homing endonuclease